MSMLSLQPSASAPASSQAFSILNRPTWQQLIAFDSDIKIAKGVDINQSPQSSSGAPGVVGSFNPNPPQPPPPPGEPYTPFPPRQMPDGTWVQPTGAPQNSFVIPLRFGMSNSDVARLQTLLAQDSSLYPEGLVTGYFGTLTRQAVTRFQEKYASEILQPLGLNRGTGFVGSATLRKLSELVK